MFNDRCFLPLKWWTFPRRLLIPPRAPFRSLFSPYTPFEEGKSHGQRPHRTAWETRRHEGQDSRASRGLTSAVSLDDLVRLSTSDIAGTLIISGSSASQYLNDLVRAGLVVKEVAGRPVRYFSSPRVPEAFSGKALCKRVRLARRPHPGDEIADHRDFARAVGFDLSLSSVVEQCRLRFSTLRLAYPSS